ncbi:MAG: hypothetical protein V4492_08365 [Chlamydiota bacterium]
MQARLCTIFSEQRQACVSELLAYLKDPLTPRQTLFCTAEEWAFFQTLETPSPEPTPVFKARPLPARVPDPVNPPQYLRQDLPKEQSYEAPRSNQTPAPPVEMIKSVPASLSPASVKREAPSGQHDFAEIRRTLQKIAPSIGVQDAIPSDEAAKKISTAYKETLPEIETVVLLCDDGQEWLDFVKSLAKAVDQHLSKAKVILASRLEQEKRWDLFIQKNGFRLIIATPGIQNCKGFLHFYESLPAKPPLLTLSAVSHYHNQEHKAKLWKTLCQMLQK